MAFWQRKEDRKGVPKYVFVYSSIDGVQTPLKRKDTKHLDALTDTQIEAWVQQYSIQFENSQVHPDSLNYSDSNLNKLVKGFSNFRLKRKKNASMVKGQENLLLDYAIPFFLKQRVPLKDPSQWPSVSPKLLNYLEERGLSPYSIVKLNIALRKFFIWLEEEGEVLPNLKLRLRTPIIEDEKTPLKISISPNEALMYAKKCQDIDFRLIILLGYFCSLRPQEIFGLKYSDFVSGDDTEKLECCRTMARMKFFNRLAVKIDRQRRENGEEGEPKTIESNAWVACFNKEAAELIVEILNEKEARKHVKKPEHKLTKKGKPRKRKPSPKSDFLINEFLPDRYIKKWKLFCGIKEDTVIKDMRRASLKYLGHETDFGLYPISLMHHARHKEIETTLIYCRVQEQRIERKKLAL